MNNLKVACLQLNSTSHMADNLQKVAAYCEMAVKNKVQLLVTPENVCQMPLPAQNLIGMEKEHPGLIRFKELAKTHKLWMLLGSLVIKDSAGKLYNRSYLINDRGEIVASYDKIHLFCARLSVNETYSEADLFSSGNKAILIKTLLGVFGMSICYDLRFPGLYRELAQKGANCIFVPSAFTKTTGKVHWEYLLRARAIETGCYILAPNQCGVHADGRETHGYSMIVSPWGEVIDCLEDAEGMIEANIDLGMVEEARSKIPSLRTSLSYSIQVVE